MSGMLRHQMAYLVQDDRVLVVNASVGDVVDLIALRQPDE